MNHEVKIGANGIGFHRYLSAAAVDRLQFLADSASTAALFFKHVLCLMTNPDDASFTTTGLGIEDPNSEELNGNDRSDLFGEAVGSADRSFVGRVAIAFWMHHPEDERTIILLSRLCVGADDLLKEIASELLELIIFVEPNRRAQKLCCAFLMLVQVIPETRLPLSTSHGLLTFLFSKIVQIEGEDSASVAGLFLYYSFLCEEYIVDLILPYLADDYIIPSVENFLWPWYDFTSMTERYAKIKEARNSSEDRNKKIWAVTSDLDQSSQQSLIPTILYLSAIGDVENELWLLRLLWKRKNIPSIVTRLEQISGYRMDDDVRDMEEEERGRWIAQRLKVCGTVVSKRILYSYHLQSIKQLYPLLSMHDSVICSLIVAGVLSDDADINRMLLSSVRKSTSHISLSKFLIIAIEMANEYATEIIAARLLRRGYYRTVLKGLRFANLKHSSNVAVSLLLIQGCLQCYDALTPAKKRKGDEDISLYATLVQEYGVGSPLLYFKTLGATFEKEAEIRRLMDMKRYDELYATLSVDTPVDMLDVALQLALSLKSSQRILAVYQLLCATDHVRASQFSVAVEPWLRIYNKHQPKASIVPIATSSIWLSPAKISGGEIRPKRRRRSA